MWEENMAARCLWGRPGGRSRARWGGAASVFMGGRGEQDDLAGLAPDLGVEQQGLGGL